MTRSVNPVLTYGVNPMDRETQSEFDGARTAALQLTIGALAKAADVGVETIRYYQRRGLLAQPRQTRGAYRVYGEAELARRKRSDSGVIAGSPSVRYPSAADACRRGASTAAA